MAKDERENNTEFRYTNNSQQVETGPTQNLGNNPINMKFEVSMGHSLNIIQNIWGNGAAMTISNCDGCETTFPINSLPIPCKVISIPGGLDIIPILGAGAENE